MTKLTSGAGISHHQFWGDAVRRALARRGPRQHSSKAGA